MQQIAVPRANQRMKRDWFRILRDLMAQGVSMGAVARSTGRDVTTVKAWGDGSEPKDTDARIVLALYAKHCPVQYRRHQAEFYVYVEVEDEENPDVEVPDDDADGRPAERVRRRRVQPVRAGDGSAEG